MGQISVSGGTVSYQGATIGTFGGGTGGTDLVVNFNSAAATMVAVQALLADIQFPPRGIIRTVIPRTVIYTVNDGDGGTSTGSATATINVQRVNDPPIVTTGNTLNYTENQAASNDLACGNGDRCRCDLVRWRARSQFGFSVNGTSADQLTIANVGTGAGQISVSGNTVSYQGVAFGDWFSGGGERHRSGLVSSFTQYSANPGGHSGAVEGISNIRTHLDNPSTAGGGRRSHSR